jgi:hypothetical protein
MRSTRLRPPPTRQKAPGDGTSRRWRTSSSQVAAVNLYLARARFAWKTSRKWEQYEPTDVVSLPTAPATYNVRITGKRAHPNGLIEWEGALEDAAIYSQNGVASAVSNYPGQTVVVPGSAIMHLLDIPILRDDDNNAGFYGAYARRGGGRREPTLHHGTAPFSVHPEAIMGSADVLGNSTIMSTTRSPGRVLLRAKSPPTRS